MSPALASSVAGGPAPTTHLKSAAAATAQPGRADITASPAGVSEPSSRPLFGSERVVDIIQREQRNQMLQARTKGTTTDAQTLLRNKAPAGGAPPHGSGGPASSGKGRGNQAQLVN